MYVLTALVLALLVSIPCSKPEAVARDGLPTIRSLNCIVSTPGGGWQYSNLPCPKLTNWMIINNNNIKEITWHSSTYIDIVFEDVSSWPRIIWSAVLCHESSHICQTYLPIRLLIWLIIILYSKRKGCAEAWPIWRATPKTSQTSQTSQMRQLRAPHTHCVLTSIRLKKLVRIGHSFVVFSFFWFWYFYAICGLQQVTWDPLADERHRRNVVPHLINGQDAITNHLCLGGHKVGKDKSRTITQHQIISHIESLRVTEINVFV